MYINHTKLHFSTKKSNLLYRDIRLHKHLRKRLELLGAADFFCEEWEGDDVEELVV